MTDSKIVQREQQKKYQQKRVWSRVELRKWMKYNAVYIPGESVNQFYEILDGVTYEELIKTQSHE